MSYPELNRRNAVAVKVESEAGSYNAPSFADDAIRCIGVSEPEEAFFATNDRLDHQTAGLGRLPGAPRSGRFWRFRMRFAVQGAGAAYSASVLPQAAAVLRAAGMSQAVVTTSESESASYSFNDDPVTTVSALLRASGKQYAIKGGVCESFSAEVDAGGFLIVDCVIVGVHHALTEQAIGTVTYAGPVNPPLWKGANSLLIGEYPPQGRSLSIDFGLSAEPNVSNNAEDGLLFFKVVGRQPTLTVNARIPALATWNPRSALVDATPFTVDAVVGSAQFNRVKLDVDNATYIDVQDQPDGEMRNYAAQILCGVHATNELTFRFD